MTSITNFSTIGMFCTLLMMTVWSSLGKMYFTVICPVLCMCQWKHWLIMTITYKWNYSQLWRKVKLQKFQYNQWDWKTLEISYPRLRMTNTLFSLEWRSYHLLNKCIQVEVNISKEGWKGREGRQGRDMRRQQRWSQPEWNMSKNLKWRLITL